MDIICPYCRQTLEGDESLIGETVQCPGCRRSFEIRASQPPDKIGRPVKFDSSQDIESSISGETKDSHREWVGLSIGVGVLALIVVAVFAVPAYQKHQKDLTARRIMRERQIAEEERKEKLKIEWPRSSEDAEKYLELAFKSLFPENEGKKDIVTAYRRFEEARKRGCRPAGLAIAHLCWTATNEDRKKLEVAGIQVKESTELIELWEHAAQYSPIAKFELGYYEWKKGDSWSSWSGKNKVYEAAEFGCKTAITVVKEYEAAQKLNRMDRTQRLGDTVFYEVFLKDEEVTSNILTLCDLDLRKEFNLHSLSLLKEEFSKTKKELNEALLQEKQDE